MGEDLSSKALLQEVKIARKFFLTNYKIPHEELRILDEFGQQIGIMSKMDAITQAKTKEKDIILITENAKPPVAKMIAFSKFKYQLDQLKSESKKKAKKQEIKEVRFRPFMGTGDFDARMKRIYEFLEDGDKVRPYVEFKGREITRKEFGFKMIEKIIDLTQDIASVELTPKMNGRKLMCQLMPVKKKKVKTEVEESKSLNERTGKKVTSKSN